MHKSCKKNIFSCFPTVRLMALLLAALLLSGCGDSPLSSMEQTSSPEGEDASDAMTYQITEQLLPEPETAFLAPEENLVLSQTDLFSANGKLCYLYTIYHMQDDLPVFYGNCLFLLNLSVKQWDCHTIPLDSWGSDPYYIAQEIVDVNDEGVVLALQELGGSVSFPDSLGFYSREGNLEFWGRVDISHEAATSLYFTGESLYAVSGGSFTVYDLQLKPGQSQNLTNRLTGCIASDPDFLWYGFDTNRNLVVWDRPNGNQLFLLGDMVNAYADFCLIKTDSGNFILADTSGIWMGDGTAPLEKILSFAERDYTIEELLSVSPQENGKFCLITRFDDGLYLLTAEPCKTSELPIKQEITIVAYNTSILEKVAVAFNRQSGQYHVTLIDVSAMADRSDYLQSLQLELSAGRGPDLVSPYVIDREGGIQNGFLAPLEDIIEDPAEYWDACLEIGKENGVTYGIPYRVYLSTLFTSNALSGGLKAWSLEQMMETVRNSPAEALEMDLDGISLVLQYGLMTPDNPQFIDYDNGISHLTEQPFLDFLEFARDYGDQLSYTADKSNAADYYRDGQLATCYLTVNAPGDLLFPASCFSGEEVMIGYPDSQGRGVRMGAELLYLNSSAPCKEGAKEFLRYLISAEGQLCYARNYNNYNALSCRRDVTEKVLDIYQSENDKAIYNTFTHVGITYEYKPLNDEQLALFWRLFEEARPEWTWPGGLTAMITEELSPYFAGDCSAEEAAGKLDSRIQIYLNEYK